MFCDGITRQLRSFEYMSFGRTKAALSSYSSSSFSCRTRGRFAPRFLLETSAGCLALVTAASIYGSCNAEEDASKKDCEKSKYSVYDLPLGNGFPRVLPCFIEVAKGSRNKYEWDDKIGFLRLDRVLHSAVFYPHNYGFYPQTLCGDGDPLDVLVLGEELVPGSVVDVRAIGYMIMEDEKGLDEKVLAVPTSDPRFDEYKTLRDVPEHLLREIAHFFETYKALEKKKWAKVGGWKGTEDTLNLIEQTHEMYKAAKAKANRANAKEISRNHSNVAQ